MPDEVVDRFCILGPARGPRRAARRSWQSLGVDQFAVYNMHDAREATMDAYGDQVMPATREAVRAKH